MVRASASYAENHWFESNFRYLKHKGSYTVSGSGADCKSAVSDSGGSTPSLPIPFFNRKESILLVVKTKQESLADKDASVREIAERVFPHPSSLR